MNSTSPNDLSVPSMQWNWFFLLSYVIASIAGMFVPNDVFKKLDIAPHLVGVFASWNPQVSALGRMRIPAAEANQFLYAVLWCVMPIYWFLVARDYFSAESKTHPLVANSPLHVVGVIGGLVALTVVLTFPIGEPGSRLGGFLFQNVVSRSLMAPLIVFTFGYFVISLLCVIWFLITGRVRLKESRGSKDG